MVLLRDGQRSSLHRDGDVVYRRYHDTGACVVVAVPRGLSTRAAAGPRRYRGDRTHEDERPPHRARAEAALMASTTIDEVARRCGVRRSTAWQYVTTTCEASARAARHVLDGTALVCPELRATASGVDLTGSLTTVMERVAERLDGDVAWRCEKDRYAQLRLLRVCLGRVADRDAEAKDDDGQRDVSSPRPGPGRPSVDAVGRARVV